VDWECGSRGKVKVIAARVPYGGYIPVLNTRCGVSIDLSVDQTAQYGPYPIGPRACHMHLA